MVVEGKRNRGKLVHLLDVNKAKTSCAWMGGKPASCTRERTFRGEKLAFTRGEGGLETVCGENESGGGNPLKKKILGLGRVCKEKGKVAHSSKGKI